MLRCVTLFLLVGPKVVAQSWTRADAGVSKRPAKFLSNLFASPAWSAKATTVNWTWKEIDVPTSPSGRLSHAATNFDDDKVLIFGGVDENMDVLDDTWMLKEVCSANGTGTWILLNTTGDVPIARYAHTLVTLYDGRVVMFGGAIGENRSDEVWVLDVAEKDNSATWIRVSITGQGPVARGLHSAVPLPDGRMLIFGGSVTESQVLNDVWVLALEPGMSAGAWIQVDTRGGPPTRRAGHSSVITSGGHGASGSHMVVFGGLTLKSPGQPIVALDDSWVLSMDTGATTGTWTKLVTSGGPPMARGLHSAVMSSSGKMRMFGGLGHGPNIMGDMWELSLQSDVAGSWMEVHTPDASPPARAGTSLTFLRGTVMFGGFGGEDIGFGPLNDTWVLV